jgi:hypothetical protein
LRAPQITKEQAASPIVAVLTFVDIISTACSVVSALVIDEISILVGSSR